MTTTTNHTVLLPDHVVPVLGPAFDQIARDAGHQATIIPFGADGVTAGDPGPSEALFRYFPADRANTTQFGTPQFQRLIDAAPALRWIQTNSSGVDYLLRIPAIATGTYVVTNGASVNQGPMAENIMALLLGIARRLPEHVRHQLRHEWQRYRKLELNGSTILIVGYGHIGAEVGRLCQAFGMRVIVVRQRPDAPSPHADAVYPPDQLTTALAEADFVVLVSATRPGQPPLMSTATLAAMKPSAWLINVGRGALVDDDALLVALQAGQIAGAALDVFTQEPLPADHPYWELPNVLITPHNSASSPHQDARTLALFTENFRRWVHGEALLNQVDLRRGY